MPIPWIAAREVSKVVLSNKTIVSGHPRDSQKRSRERVHALPLAETLSRTRSRTSARRNE